MTTQEKIHELHEKHGMQLVTIAARIGVSASTVYQYHSGARKRPGEETGNNIDELLSERKALFSEDD